MALTRETLINYLNTKMGLDTSQIDDQTPLFSSALLDSFSMVDLIMFIEQEADFKVEPWEVNLDNLDSVSRILQFVTSHK